MPEPARPFRLDDDAGGSGLSCDAGGLALAGVPLLYRTAAGFVPRQRDELDHLLRHANQGREQPLTLPVSGLLAVAWALNRNDLAKAQLAAVFMRVPELDPDSVMRLIMADDVLTKYSPDQPRDDHGRWSADGGGPAGPSSSTHAAEVARTFLAHHVAHASILPNGTAVKSAPRPELVEAIKQYATTPIGQKVLSYANEHGVTQQFTYDPRGQGPQTSKSTSNISYNAAGIAAYANGKAPGDPYVPGDQHQTASLTTALAHEIGHTRLGRAALNLPAIPSPPPVWKNHEFVITTGPTVQEEFRATRLFENPARKALGLPQRTSYYEENDLLHEGK